MFTRPVFGNPFQPFTPGLSPFTAASGISGITPFLPQQPQLIGTFGGYGVTPNPLAFSQLPTINPTFLPYPVPQVWGGSLNQGWINPASQLFGGEANYPGFLPFSSQFGSPFSSQFGWGTASPFLTQEPIVNPLLAQQLNPLAQQRLPIRSLVNPQQIDPYQAGISGVPVSVFNQTIDPYSLAAQAQFMSQLGAIPLQTGRAYSSPNWFVPPYPMGQTYPIAQVGVPFGI